MPLRRFGGATTTYQHEKPHSVSVRYECAHRRAVRRKFSAIGAPAERHGAAAARNCRWRKPRQAAAKQLAPNGVVKAQQSVDLGGVPGEQVTLDWSMPIGMGVDLRSMQVSAFHDDVWVIVTATDGRVGDAVQAALRDRSTSLRFPK